MSKPTVNERLSKALLLTDHNMKALHALILALDERVAAIADHVGIEFVPEEQAKEPLVPFAAADEAVQVADNG